MTSRWPWPVGNSGKKKSGTLFIIPACLFSKHPQKKRCMKMYQLVYFKNKIPRATCSTLEYQKWYTKLKKHWLKSLNSRTSPSHPWLKWTPTTVSHIKPLKSIHWNSFNPWAYFVKCQRRIHDIHSFLLWPFHVNWSGAEHTRQSRFKPRLKAFGSSDPRE